MDFLRLMSTPENLRVLTRILIPAFMAILFIQSGLDKVFDFKGNLEYYKSHFSKTFLASTVTLLTYVLTVLEVIAGFLCAIGTFALFFGNPIWALYGLVFCALDFLCLFFGQRVAKDYAGAVTIATYFILNIAGLLLLI